MACSHYRQTPMEKNEEQQRQGPIEIAVVGDLTDNEPDICEKLIDIPPGGECILYFDSVGGSAYAAMALTSLITLRGLKATGVVAGECTSAALWPFAACRRRLVTRMSVLLFHPMKWQSEESVGLPEAAEWARHFKWLETDMDAHLAEMFGVSLEKIQEWSRPGRYVIGTELVEAGLAELVDFKPLDFLDYGEE